MDRHHGGVSNAYEPGKNRGTWEFSSRCGQVVWWWVIALSHELVCGMATQQQQQLRVRLFLSIFARVKPKDDREFHIPSYDFASVTEAAEHLNATYCDERAPGCRRRSWQSLARA